MSLAWAALLLLAAADPALQIADCPHEPGCSALMLLEEIELNNEGSSSLYAVRRQIKLFTQRGIDAYADTQVEGSVGAYNSIVIADIDGTAGKEMYVPGSLGLRKWIQ